jgi:hypothetical protein
VTTGTTYYKNVFVNCPYDTEYAQLFLACLFTIKACGFNPLCATNKDNAGKARLDKIIHLIKTSRYSIHDLSRTGIDTSTKLSRFNMPFELGIVYGAINFNSKHKTKTILIFEKNERDILGLLSDLRSIDPKCHKNKPKELITGVRSWLKTETKAVKFPGDIYIYERFKVFKNKYPKLVAKLHLTEKSITFGEQISVIQDWLDEDNN